MTVTTIWLSWGRRVTCADHTVFLADSLNAALGLAPSRSGRRPGAWTLLPSAAPPLAVTVPPPGSPPRAPHTCSSNQGPGLPPPRCDLRRRNRPSCPTPALHSPDTALAQAFLACFIHLQNSFLRPQKTRTVPPAHARSERARPASGRVLGMRRDRGETSCKQPSMRKKSNNW